ncbi:P-loop containing nucleoside triphosphate hydrolase protein [Piromyces finnis]|uniref:ATP-dependent RNA helicase n=1 Tax=Piromyces finnis TaxID=1754191 RepID=A0A1Y1V9X3_9FUNG|nr:P-loop containing nucleoside triphosphate hydrolase protein [Piromyces finnis]|eukprot:ORX50692.1 P-loop containing nucleoside triphosphate hydrolase protein [Piromyces finnis]
MAQNKRKRNNKGIIKMNPNNITDINLDAEIVEETNTNTNTNTPKNENNNNKNNTTNNDKKQKPQENSNKKNNKRRKLNKNKNNTETTEINKILSSEEEWKKISTEDLPPLPEIKPINNTNKNKNNNKNKNKNNKNKNKKNGKNNANNENKNKKEDDSEFIDLKNIDEWGWSEINYDKSLLGNEDIDGFLSLEEIKDVEVVYENNKNGKIIRFKQQKNKNKNNNGQPKKNEFNGEEFIDMDDFDWDKEKELYSNGKLGIGSDSEEEDDEYGNMDVNDVSEDKMDVDKDNVETEEPENEESKATEEAEDEEKEESNKDTTEKEEDEKKEEEKEESNTTEEVEEKSEPKPKKNENKKKKNEKKKQQKPVEKKQEEEVEIDENFDISAWKDYSLAPTIEKALKALKFSKPTEIQANTLNLSLKDKHDIIGAAETGSGKTLAFGLPVIQHIASTPKEQRNYCSGLILTPTRELAIQVKQHLMAISKFTDAFIVAIVGGMSAQKQQRLIKQKPDVIIATPGRLWELMTDHKDFSEHLRTTRFLVLDEADRMLESGHFRELEYILNIISKKRNKKKDEDLSYRRQIAVYSATLISDKELHVRIKKNNSKNTNTTFVKLIKQLEFEDKNPSYVNLLTNSIMAKPLTETKINCLQTEKDLYLYYFALLYPGKTIVFVNSIDCIRRLIPIMNLLNIKTFGLHAQMQQRQRLKNLERFRDSNNALLITSDVAARGLDIPAVDHVIHYQLPRSADIYVHRSGRTARAEREGISIALCSPEEQRLYKNLCSSLKKPNGIEDFPVDRINMNSLKERTSLALEIDKLEHKIQKTSQNNSWIKKAAEEMDVILDEDLLEEDSDDEDNRRNKNKEANKLKGLKNKLKVLLEKPIIPVGLSTKYLTSSTISNLPDILLREKGKKTSILANEGFNALNAVQKVKAKKNTK